MTAQLPQERLVKTIEQLEHFATNLKWTNVSGAQTLLFAADGLRALLAAHEQEPVAWMWDIYGGHMYAKNKPLHMPAQPLYTHPAPVHAVPDDVSIFEAAIEECRKCDSIDERAWNHGVLAVIAKYEACRAAMLNGGKS